MHVEATVNVDRLSGDEGAVLGGEKDHRADKVLWKLISLKAALASSVLKLLGLKCSLLLRARDSQSRSYCVHGNIV